jgi:hypothetical protein
MSKKTFIPVNNNIDKAIAFANSLSQDYLTTVQKLEQKQFYIPSLEVVSNLQNDGWEINGVYEHRGKDRKITSNFIQMYHPDFVLRNSKNQIEALSSLTISNSCNGNKPMTINMGAYRLVCSNGLIRYEKHAEETKIKHVEVDYNRLPQILELVDRKKEKVLEEFNLLKHKNLTTEEARQFAIQSIRLANKEVTNPRVEEMLRVHRMEDEGMNLWNVFNRVQENLTNGMTNMTENIRVNERLTALAGQYAMAI